MSKSPPAITNQQPVPKPSPRPTLAQQASSEDDELDEFVRTKILLLGLRRSGKTSIHQVLFEDLSPKQAFFVEPTTRLMKHKIDSFIPLEIWDCPGSVTPENLGVPLSFFTSIIFVIDIQDSYNQPIARLIQFMISAFQQNPDVNLEVFVHKAESLSEEYRYESFRHIQNRVIDELGDIAPITVDTPSSYPSTPPIDPKHIPYSMHLTSVYDHSLQEAFSRVFMRIISSSTLPYVEHLLNTLQTNLSSQKTFLFDTKARFYVATDSSPVDFTTFGLCCDYVHMLNKFGDLYKSAIASPTSHPRRVETDVDESILVVSPNGSQPTSPRSSKAQNAQSPSISAVASRSSTPNHTLGPSSGSHAQSRAQSPGQGSSSSTPIHARSRSSTNARPLDAEVAALNSSTSGSHEGSNGNGSNGHTRPRRTVFHPTATASLSPHYTLIFQSITPRLALLALVTTDIWKTKRGLVEYNIVYFREGVQEIYDLVLETSRKKTKKPGQTSNTNARLPVKR
ncbi:gtr1 g gtr2 [Pyrrhoderma noxium]|uniref:Gtr1 g gtr2 n=1 Tax=Pyrrhoderma noxium TaxID=2282107 RepID=A0A286U9A6_9AGAM|nr:gtr1 g gtr2 [Pyrrhoderma noxium]